MSIYARPATPGPTFDTATKIRSRETADALWRAGYRNVGRYLPLPNNDPSGDIDAPELDLLCGIGFGVFLIQHPRAPGWRPADHSGASDGITAVNRARMAGYPNRCHIYFDLEGIDGTVEETRVWVSSALATVRLAGYGGGVYVGFEQPLSPMDLYLLHNANTYGCDWGDRQVAERGFAWKQTAPDILVAGVRIDKGVILPDLKGELPIVAADDSVVAVA